MRTAASSAAEAHRAPAPLEWTVSASIERGVEFLRSRACPHGTWTSFETLAGTSDEWVNAYVGCCLASLEDPEAVALARAAHRSLVRRCRWTGGWGYNRFVPADADSTAWVLRLGEILGAPAGFTRKRAYRLLRRHVSPGGGVRTFRLEGPIRLFTGLAKNISFRGWCSTHACVTAAVAQLAGDDYSETLAYLRRTQRADGSWGAYWWTDAAYATALAASALARGPDGGASLGAAVRWAQRSVGRDGCARTDRFPQGSAFATAWLLHLSSHGSDPGTAFDLAAWMLSRQREDGSWEASASLRIPPPGCVDPDTHTGWSHTGRGGGSIILDRNRVFTTATGLLALHAFASRCLRRR